MSTEHEILRYMKIAAHFSNSSEELQINTIKVAQVMKDLLKEHQERHDLHKQKEAKSEQ